MNNFSYKMWLKGLVFCLVCVMAFSCCQNKVNNSAEVVGADSVVLADTLRNDTSEYMGGGKGLNDIRFADFDEYDWLDNEYIRCLRKYLDDYNSGKIKNEGLEQYKEFMKGKFVIGWAEPFMMGGLFVQFIFIDYPEHIFAAWVYSGVDEEKEEVLDYEVRCVSLDEEKSDFTKEDILELVKERPEYKLW